MGRRMNHRDEGGIERETSKDDSTNDEDTLFMMLVVTRCTAVGSQIDKPHHEKNEIKGEFVLFTFSFAHLSPILLIFFGRGNL